VDGVYGHVCDITWQPGSLALSQGRMAGTAYGEQEEGGEVKAFVAMAILRYHWVAEAEVCRREY
jgi:hypothetical protein